MTRERVPWFAALAAEFDEAARNWREKAKQQRVDACRSSMSGEDGVPSHVISIARALTFEYAAKRLHEAVSRSQHQRDCVECGRFEDYEMEDGSWICHRCGRVDSGATNSQEQP